MSSTNINVTNGNGGSKSAIAIIVLAVLLSGVLAGSIIFCNKYKKKYKNERANTTALSRTINALQDSCKTYQIKFGKNDKRWVAETEALALKSDNIKQLYGDKLKELSKLHIRVKDLKNMADMQTVTHDSVMVPVYVDSLFSLHTDYNDGFLSLRNTIYRNGTSNIKYEYRDSFTLVNAYKRKRFLWFRYGHKKDMYYLIPKNSKTEVLNLSVIKKIE